MLFFHRLAGKDNVIIFGDKDSLTLVFSAIQDQPYVFQSYIIPQINSNLNPISYKHSWPSFFHSVFFLYFLISFSNLSLYSKCQNTQSFILDHLKRRRFGLTFMYANLLLLFVTFDFCVVVIYYETTWHQRFFFLLSFRFFFFVSFF